MNWYKTAKKELSKKRVYVDSDAINFISYNASNKELTVKFKHGGIYKYTGVPKKVFENFTKARSKGEYFNRTIKDKYNYSS